MHPRHLILGAAAALILAGVTLAGPHERGPGQRTPDYARWQAELGLSDAQMERLKTAHEEHRAAMRAHFEASRKEGDELRARHQAALGKILTPAQMAELEAKREDFRADMREARAECREEMRDAMKERRGKR